MKNLKTTFYLFLTMLCCTLVMQAQDKPVTLDFDNFEANMELMQTYVKDLKDGNAAKLNSHFADNAMIFGLGSTSDSITKKQHLDRYTDAFKANNYSIDGDIYLSVKTDDNAAVPPGEYAFGWGNVTVTDKASKKSAKTSYHVVARIDNGKITYLWHYYDPVPMLQHAGYTITPPKE